MTLVLEMNVTWANQTNFLQFLERLSIYARDAIPAYTCSMSRFGAACISRGNRTISLSFRDSLLTITIWQKGSTILSEGEKPRTSHLVCHNDEGYRSSVLKDNSFTEF